MGIHCMCGAKDPLSPFRHAVDCPVFIAGHPMEGGRNWYLCTKRCGKRFQTVDELVGHVDGCPGDARTAPVTIQFTENDAGLRAMVTSAESLARRLMHTMTADELGRLRGIIEGWRGPRRTTVFVRGRWDEAGKFDMWLDAGPIAKEPPTPLSPSTFQVRVEIEEGRWDE